jgi:hypothetical protein
MQMPSLVEVVQESHHVGEIPLGTEMEGQRPIGIASSLGCGGVDLRGFQLGAIDEPNQPVLVQGACQLQIGRQRLLFPLGKLLALAPRMHNNRLLAGQFCLQAEAALGARVEGGHQPVDAVFQAEAPDQDCGDYGQNAFALRHGCLLLLSRVAGCGASSPRPAVEASLSGCDSA